MSKFVNSYLDENLIINCPLTGDDAKRAINIYGADLGTLKSKTVKKQNTGILDYTPV